jgi:CheY-like chemotaxis protein
VIDLRPEVSPVTQRVLVAEDEVLVRLSVAEGLRNEGLEVLEAADAEEAISILKTLQVDVVITDLYMRTPADGLAVARLCPSALSRYSIGAGVRDDSTD